MADKPVTVETVRERLEREDAARRERNRGRMSGAMLRKILTRYRGRFIAGPFDAKPVKLPLDNPLRGRRSRSARRRGVRKVSVKGVA